MDHPPSHDDNFARTSVCRWLLQKPTATQVEAARKPEKGGYFRIYLCWQKLHSSRLMRQMTAVERDIHSSTSGESTNSSRSSTALSARGWSVVSSMSAHSLTRWKHQFTVLYQLMIHSTIQTTSSTFERIRDVMIMRYTNLLFTYLLAYLLTYLLTYISKY